MPTRCAPWTTFAPLLFCACFAAGCGGDGEAGGSDGTSGSGGSAASGGTGGSGNTSGTGGTGAGGADCGEGSTLFALEALGSDGDEIIRDVEVDETTRDAYFITTDDLYVVREGSNEPTLLAELPASGSHFWLTDDAVLAPGNGSLEPCVLLATDRDGGNVRVVVPLPVEASINWHHEALDVQVIGDDVFWVGVDRYTDDPAALFPEFQFTYSVRRTSWSAPGTPEDIYSTDRYIDSLVLAGGKAYIEEEIGEVQSFEYEQKTIDLATGEVDATTTLDRFGGRVVDGDDTALMVSRFDIDDLENMGTYRVPPSGGVGERLSDNAFVINSGFRDGLWVFTDTPAPNATTIVKSHRPGSTVNQIGCIEGGAVDFDVWVGASEALITVDIDTDGTILGFEL